jgi:hypothetical protein
VWNVAGPSFSVIIELSLDLDCCTARALKAQKKILKTMLSEIGIRKNSYQHHPATTSVRTEPCLILKFFLIKIDVI